MAGIVISSLSTVYVQVPVYATIAGASYDPTSDTVQMAFTLNGASPQSWNTASWTAGPGAGSYLAQILVGPGDGGLDLAAGSWTTWVKVTSDPEIPVLNCGLTVIT